MRPMRVDLHVEFDSRAAASTAAVTRRVDSLRPHRLEASHESHRRDSVGRVDGVALDAVSRRRHRRDGKKTPVTYDTAGP